MKNKPTRTPLRLSPVHSELRSLLGTWQNVNGMPTLMTVATPIEHQLKTLALADVSCLMRTGVKGAGAAKWLQEQGIVDLPVPNSWQPLVDGGLIARLGFTEFLIEDGWHSQTVSRLNENQSRAKGSLPAKVYPILRQDLAIVLWGRLVPDLFQQTCNVNVRALNLADRPIVVTSMIGVAVTILADERNGLPFYRLWYDGTFGIYVWKTLLSIVQELGGDVIGFAQIEHS